MPHIFKRFTFLKKMEKKWTRTGLSQQLIDFCVQKKQWTTPTDIQYEVCSSAKEQKDIIAVAETGSGKTAAFLLPIFDSYLTKGNGGIFCLILAPTKELVNQISIVANEISKWLQFDENTILPLMGGADIKFESRKIALSPIIIISTPGRVLDHLKNTNGFSLKSAKYFVLDEADKLIDTLDFLENVDDICKYLPQKRTTFLFSATLTHNWEKLMTIVDKEAIRIDIDGKEDKSLETNRNSNYILNKNIKQFMVAIAMKNKPNFLYNYLDHVGHKHKLIMIFVNTCSLTLVLSDYLSMMGVNSLPLHGKMTLPKRKAAIATFKCRNKNVLVCTDVAGRGLDIPNVDYVINYDVPEAVESYVHRVGRTGRAGNTGTSIVFVGQYELQDFCNIETKLSIRIDEFKEITEDNLLITIDKSTEKYAAAQQALKSNGILKEQIYNKNNKKQRKYK